MKDVFIKVQPSEPELVSNFFLGTILVILLVTVIDIVVHDGYVLDDISDCYPGNNSDRCLKLYDTHNCDIGNQMCLGNDYWSLLTIIVQVVGISLMIGRIVVGKLGGSKTNPMLFVVGGMWYLSAVILFYFGWLDLLYYVLRGLSVDSMLPWLDGIGLFSLIQGFGVSSSVDSSDLYLLNFIGVLIYGILWGFMVHHHRQKTWKKLGLV